MTEASVTPNSSAEADTAEQINDDSVNSMVADMMDEDGSGDSDSEAEDDEPEGEGEDGSNSQATPLEEKADQLPGDGDTTMHDAQTVQVS